MRDPFRKVASGMHAVSAWFQTMSYLHCPSCMRAYNLAVQSTCPYCPVAATVVDPAEDIVHAAEQLARAMARATPSERSAAAARMDHLALPAPGDDSARHRAPVLRQIRDVLDPLPAMPTPKPTLFLAIASEVERRFMAHMPRLPKMPRLLGDGLRRVRARVKALAQAA
jgi:hypothetical protein